MPQTKEKFSLVEFYEKHLIPIRDLLQLIPGTQFISSETEPELLAAAEQLKLCVKLNPKLTVKLAFHADGTGKIEYEPPRRLMSYDGPAAGVFALLVSAVMTVALPHRAEFGQAFDNVACVIGNLPLLTDG